MLEKVLADISAAAGNLNLGTVSTAIESVNTKFLAMSAIAITALTNIASKAADVGMRVVKSLALEGITSGFAEYELKLGSIQTIMAGTGAPLDEVNKKLQTLNEYSDKTIYSFKDMTSNIGKFTNAGVSLEGSVQAIQGVAQVAAISGANADEASRAMYNFAQALSRGNVELIDWKSIEMANMGTKEFKDQLLQTAAAVGTLRVEGDHYVSGLSTPVSATQNFNDTLKNGWLTTEVLTTTLAKYTDQTTELGKKAFAAAQDLKTFHQLMDTTKEAIGSGWAQSFEIIVGNFEEAKQVWGTAGAAIGKFVNENADARNKLLQSWKDLGGRFVLFHTLQNLFENLARIMAPIKQAFQDIFPPIGARRLVEMTVAFSKLVDKLRPSLDTVANLKTIFKGFFSILDIGWTVIKEGIKFIGGLVKAIVDLGGGGLVTTLVKISEFFIGLRDALVKGEGIKNFFEILGDVIKIPIALIGDLSDKVKGFFGAAKDAGEKVAAADPFGRVKDRIQSLSEVFDKITSLWAPIRDFFGKVKGVFDDVMGQIGKWLGDFGEQLGKAFASGNFNKILDSLNVGLFGGLLLLINKFLKQGVKINATVQGFFGGGLFEKVGKSFDALTGTLGAMQSKLKAEALMKIAIAIGILTVSVVALSLIDSAALTKALTAMAVGFGQLMAAFAILEKISATPKTAATFGIVAAGMIMMGGALLILSGAMAVLGRMSWSEIVTGLVAISGLIAIMAVSAKLLSSLSGDMISAGIGLTAMGTGLGVLAIALKIMSTMDLIEMGKGFIGIAAGLAIIAAAMNLMPKNMILQSVGLLAISASLIGIGVAMKIFGTMSWGDIGRGLAAIAGALLLIGFAVEGMPATLPLVGVGLILVGESLVIIAAAMKIMGSMKWEEIGRGLAVMGASLAILAIAVNAMTGAVAGAIALGIVAPALMALALVLKAFAVIEFGDLIHGLIGIAAVLAVLGLAAMALQPAVGAMIAMGIALVAIGAGFALFGVGIAKVAEGLALFINLGPQAATALGDMLRAIGKALPSLFLGAAEGVVEFIAVIKDNAPAIVDALITILGKLLDGIEKLVPKILKILAKLIDGVIDYLTTDGIPRLVEGILGLIVALLTGIRDHIDDVVIVVGEIVVAFVDALAVELPKIVDSVANLFVTLLNSVAEAVGRVSGTLMFGIGISLINGMLDGMGQTLGNIWPWIKEQFNKIIEVIKGIFGINSPSTVMMDVGVDIITGLLNGIIEAAVAVKDWFAGVAGKVLEWIGDTAQTLIEKGVGFITGLFTGITNKIVEVKDFFAGIGKTIIGWIGDALTLLKDTGWDIIQGLWHGIEERWDMFIEWIKRFPKMIVESIPNPLGILLDVGSNIIQGMWNGIQTGWDKMTSWISDAASHLPGFIKGPLNIKSPSKVMMGIGKDIIGGLTWAFEHDDTIEATTKDFTAKMQESLATIMNNIEAEYKPTITPVMNIDPAMAELNRKLSAMNLTPESSQMFYQIQRMNRLDPTFDYIGALNTLVETGGARYQLDPWEQMLKQNQEMIAKLGITYQQNIYAPTQLSMTDIYKQTRNQITMAKEELSIP